MSYSVPNDEYESWIQNGPTQLRDLAEHACVEHLLALTDGSHSMFGSRRKLAEALGIGESTIAGWVKESTLPPLAKSVVALIHLSEKAREPLFRDYIGASEELGDVIVRDGDGYMVVHYSSNPFDRGAGLPTVIGEIAARGIPDQQTAERLVSHERLRNGLKMAIAELRDAVEKDAKIKAGVFEHGLLGDMLAHLEHEAGLERPDDERQEL